MGGDDQVDNKGRMSRMGTGCVAVRRESDTAVNPPSGDEVKIIY